MSLIQVTLNLQLQVISEERFYAYMKYTNIFTGSI